MSCVVKCHPMKKIFNFVFNSKTFIKTKLKQYLVQINPNYLTTSLILYYLLTSQVIYVNYCRHVRYMLNKNPEHRNHLYGMLPLIPYLLILLVNMLIFHSNWEFVSNIITTKFTLVLHYTLSQKVIFLSHWFRVMGNSVCQQIIFSRYMSNLELKLRQ